VEFDARCHGAGPAKPPTLADPLLVVMWSTEFSRINIAADRFGAVRRQAADL
jgi:hypothetical protein